MYDTCVHNHIFQSFNCQHLQYRIELHLTRSYFRFLFLSVSTVHFLSISKRIKITTLCMLNTQGYHANVPFGLLLVQFLRNSSQNHVVFCSMNGSHGFQRGPKNRKTARVLGRKPQNHMAFFYKRILM